MYYIAAEIYDEASFDKIVKTKVISGVVLGDPYCQKRMFPYGETDLADYAIRAHESGLKVIFQSPCYMTQRIFDAIKTLMLHLYGKGLCNDILIQDVGLAFEIKKMFPEINLIWSQISRSRNGAENMLFYKFLKNNGISAAELFRPELACYLRNIDMVSVYSDKQINYNTVNRKCYYIHELGLWDRDCGRGCLDRKARLVNDDRGIDLTIDGYKLNSYYSEVNLSSVDTDKEIVLLRGRDVDEIIGCTGSLRG